MVMSRAEVLRASGPTSGSTIKVKLGAAKDGKINAAARMAGLRGGRVTRVRRSPPAR